MKLEREKKLHKYDEKEEASHLKERIFAFTDVACLHGVVINRYSNIKEANVINI
jgi:hypothetical protein